jgi:hypothetical protein
LLLLLFWCINLHVLCTFGCTLQLLVTTSPLLLLLAPLLPCLCSLLLSRWVSSTCPLRCWV